MKNIRMLWGSRESVCPKTKLTMKACFIRPFRLMHNLPPTPDMESKTRFLRRTQTNKNRFIEWLLCTRRNWENHRTHSAIIAVLGSVWYSVERYEYTGNLLKEKSPGVGLSVSYQWPSYYKVHKYFGEIINHRLRRSGIIKLTKKSGKNDFQLTGTMQSWAQQHPNRCHRNPQKRFTFCFQALGRN